MPETTAPVTTPAAAPAAPAAAAPAATPAFAMPNPRPRDDADFLTGENLPVVCSCVGVEINQAGNGADVFRLALRVAPGERDATGADVGGRLIVTDKYLSENALEYTLDTLKLLGSVTAEELQAAIKSGNEARKAELVPKLLGELSGPFAASGLGKYPVKVSTKDETFTPKKGAAIVTRKVGFINPVPKKADETKLKSLGATLLANTKSGGAAGARPAAATGGASSPPPAVTQGPGGGTDEVPF